MRILAFDTATGACSAALWEDGAVIRHRFEAMEKGHSERLMPMLAQVMAEAGCGYGDLDLIAVTTGPGGFTGVRIGLAAARGLALARGLPCLGVTTFDAVAAAVPDAERRDKTLLVTLETKRADVYAQAYGDGLTPLDAPAAVAPDDLGGLLAGRGGGGLVVAGDAAGRALAALLGAGMDARASTASGTPDAAVVADLTAARWAARSGDAPAPAPAPVYLKPPNAVAPKDGGRLRP